MVLNFLAKLLGIVTRSFRNRFRSILISLPLNNLVRNQREVSFHWTRSENEQDVGPTLTWCTWISQLFSLVAFHRMGMGLLGS